MKQVVFIRHGESTWNLENRFTGWTDVDLTPTGIAEAQEAGRLMKNEGITFKRAYTSYLKRAVKTLNIILDRMDLDWIPVEKSWRLNEKHYGILQGFDKEETVKKYGAEQVLAWRRSYMEAPPPVSKDDSRNPRLDPRYADISAGLLPLTESLHDAFLRVLPYWQEIIIPSLQRDHSVLVVAHGNSLRGIIKYIKAINNDDIVAFNLPTGVPYLFEFDDNMHLLSDRFVGNPDEISNRMQKAAQTKKN